MDMLLLKHLFSEKNYTVIGLENIGVPVSGLLHDAVEHYVVHCKDSDLYVACKLISRKSPPENKFRAMFYDCLSLNRERETIMKLFNSQCGFLSIKKMQEREIDFYRYAPNGIRSYIPRFWGIIDEGDRYYIIMEDVSSCECFNSIDCPEKWTYEIITHTVKNVAYIHSALKAFTPKHNNRFFMSNDTHVFLDYFHNNVSESCGISIEQKVFRAGVQYLSHLAKYESILNSKATLIHNDFNIRNICYSHLSGHIIVYDWEFIDYDSPIKDVLDFLLSLDSSIINKPNIENILKVYAAEVCDLATCSYTLSELKDLLYYSSIKYAATRMNMYLLCYMASQYKFIERMYKNLSNIISVLE